MTVDGLYVIALIDTEGKSIRYIKNFNGSDYSRFDLSLTENRDEALAYNNPEQCKAEARQFRAMGLNVKIRMMPLRECRKNTAIGELTT